VLVDSLRFLPRSFRPLYEAPAPLEGETDPVWAPFESRLAASRIALVSSAGLYRPARDAPFDADGERRDPTWGDPSWRAIPRETRQGELAMLHLHVNDADVLADHEVALPLRALDALVADGVVGASAPTHFSVMGYQAAGLQAWRRQTAPEIVARLRDEAVDGVVLAPA
jgi:D-proline reductase (dithiol) PrdB